MNRNSWQTNPILHDRPMSHSPNGSVENFVPHAEYFHLQNTPENGALKINVLLDKTIFVSGRDVVGILEIDCSSSSKVKIGEIKINIIGFEDKSLLKSTKRQFHNETVVIQSLDTAPTEAVIGSTPDEHGMWLATKRTTTFSFKAPLSSKLTPLPSSFWNEKFGGIRYIVTGIVDYKLNNKPTRIPPLTVSKEIFVLEYAPFDNIDQFFPVEANDTKTVTQRQLFSLVSGEVEVNGKAFLHDGGVWVAGSIGFVSVTIKNSSPKKITKMAVSLFRRLKTFKTIDSNDGQITAALSFSRLIICKRTFESTNKIKKITTAGNWWSEDEGSKGVQHNTKVDEWWDGVKSEDERTVMLDISIPLNSRTVRNGLLLDVSYVVNVSVFPDGSTPIEIEVPITILHPASIQSSPRLQIESRTASSANNNTIIEDTHDSQNVWGNLQLPEEPTEYGVSSILDDAASYISKSSSPIIQSSNNGFEVVVNSRPQTPQHQVFYTDHPSNPQNPQIVYVHNTSPVRQNSPQLIYTRVSPQPSLHSIKKEIPNLARSNSSRKSYISPTMPSPHRTPSLNHGQNKRVLVETSPSHRQFSASTPSQHSTTLQRPPNGYQLNNSYSPARSSIVDGLLENYDYIGFDDSVSQRSLPLEGRHSDMVSDILSEMDETIIAAKHQNGVIRMGSKRENQIISSIGKPLRGIEETIVKRSFESNITPKKEWKNRTSYVPSTNFTTENTHELITPETPLPQQTNTLVDISDDAEEASVLLRRKSQLQKIAKKPAPMLGERLGSSSTLVRKKSLRNGEDIDRIIERAKSDDDLLLNLQPEFSHIDDLIAKMAEI